jgi:tetraacyldisaccharide 4'-kinase
LKTKVFRQESHSTSRYINMQNTRHPIVTALLLPFSMLYGIVISIRNFLFDVGVFTSRQFDIPVISVGNITVGGTGKTPHVEYIVTLLKDNFEVAVLSRGYKRKTRGFILASAESGVDDVGDEPLQIKKRFPDVEVAVDANRVRGIQTLSRLNEKLKAIILDDAFQHRWVRPGITVLLVDYNQPMNKDYLLPAGRLREFISAARRAAIVVVTKCPPNFKPIERRILMNDLDLLPWQTLYFSTFKYGKPLPVFEGALAFPEREEIKAGKTAILMVTGIASPQTFHRHIRDMSPNTEQISFPDHRQFTPKDIRKIATALESMKGDRRIIVTTEKDAIRLQRAGNIDPAIKKSIYYIPISVKFLEDDEAGFKNQIFRYVKSNKRKYLLYS